MAKKVHKDKEGRTRIIELTGKDAKKLHKEMEEEASKRDMVPCECVGGAPAGARKTLHNLQDSGKWKCSRCSDEKDELDVMVAKGDDWFELDEGFETALDKALGNFKSMS